MNMYVCMHVYIYIQTYDICLFIWAVDKMDYAPASKTTIDQTVTQNMSRPLILSQLEVTRRTWGIRKSICTECIYIYFMNMSNLFPTHTHIYAHAYTIVFHFFNPIERHTNSPWPTNNLYMELVITKGSVSYLSSPCFSTSLGGIGGPARAIHGILAVMYLISIIRGGPPPENGHGFNSHG
jgi:hypothetical protein